MTIGQQYQQNTQRVSKCNFFVLPQGCISCMDLDSIIETSHYKHLHQYYSYLFTRSNMLLLVHNSHPRVRATEPQTCGSLWTSRHELISTSGWKVWSVLSISRFLQAVNAQLFLGKVHNTNSSRPTLEIRTIWVQHGWHPARVWLLKWLQQYAPNPENPPPHTHTLVLAYTCPGYPSVPQACCSVPLTPRWLLWTSNNILDSIWFLIMAVYEHAHYSIA